MPTNGGWNLIRRLKGETASASVPPYGFSVCGFVHHITYEYTEPYLHPHILP